METRADEFFDEIGTMSATDFDAWTKAEVVTWLTSWRAYVKDGGTRPGRPH